jgi:two-component system sensor histidine kinase YesM
MNIMIAALFLPMLLLYTLTNQVNSRVINQEVVTNNRSQLLFLHHQIQTNVERLSTLPSLLARDSALLNTVKSVIMKDDYGITQTIPLLQEKLYLQSYSTSWQNDIAVYLPDIKRRIATDRNDEFQMPGHKQHSGSSIWRYKNGTSPDNGYFEMYYSDSSKANLIHAIFEVKFYASNLIDLMSRYQSGSTRAPFLIADGQNPIVAKETSYTFASEAVRQLKLQPMKDGDTTITYEGRDWFVTYAYMPELDAFLVDMLPLEELLKPLIDSRNLFYAGFTLLLIIGLLFSFALYRQVQRPIGVIVKALKDFERGDLGSQISAKYRNEFDFVIHRFNEMAAQIRHLIEDVYEEQNRARLAVLKQLQAQINPHFLYNCLSFIAGSAKLGRNDTVMEMSYDLADYYRYTTRVDDSITSMSQELLMVSKYLDIHKRRMTRLSCDISIDERLLELQVPRLFLQPIVENAIKHGLEPKVGQGRLNIRGQLNDDYCVITVEDNGVGLDEMGLTDLQDKLNGHLTEEMGCGLWNVHQRLLHMYGSSSGVWLKSGAKGLGGIIVEIKWPIPSLSINGAFYRGGESRHV